MKSVRYWTVVVLLVATALLLASRNRSEPDVARERLAAIPNVIQGAAGAEQGIDAESLDVLGDGEFLSRIYSRGGAVPPVSLFVAYFPTQRTGATVHSPKNCLPGAGWIFESSTYVPLKDNRGESHRVGEYIITNGADREFVIYWYQSHGRSIASEYKARLLLVLDSIRMNRTDGALVRVITPIEGEESLPVARTRAESFVGELLPILPRFIPN